MCTAAQIPTFRSTINQAQKQTCHSRSLQTYKYCRHTLNQLMHSVWPNTVDCVCSLAHLPSKVSTGTEVPHRAWYRGICAVYSKSKPLQVKRGWGWALSTYATGPALCWGPESPSLWKTNCVPSGKPGCTCHTGNCIKSPSLICSLLEGIFPTYIESMPEQTPSGHLMLH